MHKFTTLYHVSMNLFISLYYFKSVFLVAFFFRVQDVAEARQRAEPAAATEHSWPGTRDAGVAPSSSTSRTPPTDQPAAPPPCRCDATCPPCLHAATTCLRNAFPLPPVRHCLARHRASSYHHATTLTSPPQATTQPPLSPYTTTCSYQS